MECDGCDGREAERCVVDLILPDLNRCCVQGGEEEDGEETEEGSTKGTKQSTGREERYVPDVRVMHSPHNTVHTLWLLWSRVQTPPLQIRARAMMSVGELT